MRRALIYLTMRRLPNLPRNRGVWKRAWMRSGSASQSSTKWAKRQLTAHPKFYFFDAGVFRALRPRGPLDPVEEIDGAALETLWLQELRAHNDAKNLGYSLHYWRTRSGLEGDFIVYGERGLLAFEVKRSSRFRRDDLAGLRAFCEDYPKVQARLLYLGSERYLVDGIEVVPLAQAVMEVGDWLGGGS